MSLSVTLTSIKQNKKNNNNIVYLFSQTIGAAFVAKAIQVGDKVITLGIWVSFYACVISNSLRGHKVSYKVFMMTKRQNSDPDLVPRTRRGRSDTRP